jgi:hypothetical protein
MNHVPFAPKDARGRRLRKGDLVRIVEVPALAGMSSQARAESESVFAHILGTCKRVAGFDEHGFAELSFKIRRPPMAGLHCVSIEPHLLLLQASAAPTGQRLSPVA